MKSNITFLRMRSSDDLGQQRLEAELNVAEILKNGWVGSRLEFKSATKTNPQGFGECVAKALNYATDTGEPQGGLPKEWMARALYRWLRRKKDSGDLGKNNSKKPGKPPGNQSEQTT